MSPHQSFREMFEQVAGEHADRLFVHDILGQEDVTLTYTELFDQVKAASSAMMVHFDAGSSVALIHSNGADFFVKSLALMYLECQVFVFHPDWTRDNVVDQMAQLPCSHCIVSPDLINHIDSGGLGALGISVVSVSSVTTEGRLEVVATGFRKAVQAGNANIHLATSGTTGLSKWVPKDVNEIRGNMKAFAKHLGLDHQDIIHSVLPLCTANGFYITYLMPFFAGASVLIDKKFSPLHVARYLESSLACKSTVMSLVPTILYLVNKLAAAELCERFSEQSFCRFAICGTAPLDSSEKRKFEDHMNVPVYFNYGITETLFISSQNETIRDDTSSGSFLEGMSSELSEQGEFIVSGATPFQDYFGGKFDGIDDKGRFPTGDIGFIRDGLVHVTGRSKQVVIKGGYNILPAEIDGFIIRDEDVLETFTFGVPDEVFGEKVCTTVVLREGVCESEARQRLLVYLRKHFPRYKIPEICFVNHIVKTVTGKPKKEEMIKMITCTLKGIA